MADSLQVLVPLQGTLSFLVKFSNLAANVGKMVPVNKYLSSPTRCTKCFCADALEPFANRNPVALSKLTSQASWIDTKNLALS